jgi:hypothetical protein
MYLSGMKALMSLRRVWWLTFSLVVFIGTGILLLHFVWLYHDELFGKGVPWKYLLQLMADFALMFLPLPILAAVFAAQLITWLQHSKRKSTSLPTVVRQQFIQALSGGVLFFLLVSYITPIVTKRAYVLLYDIRNMPKDNKAWEHVDPSLFDDAQPTMNLHHLIQHRALQHERDKKEFIRSLAEVDTIVANQVLTPDNIAFFRFSDIEIAQMRTTSATHSLRKSPPEFVGYNNSNAFFQKERDRRAKEAIYYMIIAPFVFIIVYLISPFIIVLLQRLKKPATEDLYP